MHNVRQLMRKKAYRTFVVSFIIVFLLPVMVLAGVVVRMTINIEQETETASRLVLEQFRSGIDGQLYTVMRAADSIVADDKSLHFAERDDPMRYLNNISSFQMLKSLTQEVGLLSMVYSNIEQCYLYLPKSGKVISNTISDAPDFFNRKLAGSFQSADEWLSFLQNQPDGFANRGRVEYLRTIRRGEMWVMTVVVTINSAPFDANSVLFAEQQTQAAVFSEAGETLFFTGAAAPALTDAMLLEANGTALVDNEGGALRAHWLKSAETGCIYLITMPESVFARRLHEIQIGSALGGGLLLICGLMLSLWLARRQYRPILALREFIESNAGHGGNGETDDFGYLSEMLQAISAENQTVGKQMVDSSSRMEQFALERLLKGMYASVIDMEAQLLALNIIFDCRMYFVACFSIDGFARGGQLLRNDLELLRFVVSNVFEELLSYFSAHTFVCDGYVWAICGVPTTAEWSQGDAWRERLEKTLREGRDFLLDRFDFSLSIAADEVNASESAGFDGIHRAYRMNMHLIRQAEGQPGSIWLSWRNMQSTYAISTGQPLAADAGRLAQLILDGDESGVESFINAWKAQCAEMPYYLSHLRWCALLQAVFSLLSGVSDNDMRAIHERIRAFVEAPLLNDDKTVLSLFLFICRLPQSRGGERVSDIALRAKAFIEENYQSSALNITQIADHLHLTPSYASSLYRRQAGESMLDSINKIRLRHAKELLVQTDMAIERIAEQAGYSNSSTFLRAFKKLEGVTPGQFRAMRAKG